MPNNLLRKNQDLSFMKQQMLESKWWYRLFKVVLVIAVFAWLLFSVLLAIAAWPDEDYIHVATCYDPISEEYRYPTEERYREYSQEERAESAYYFLDEWHNTPCNENEFWSDYELDSIELDYPYFLAPVSGIVSFAIGLVVLWLIHWTVLYVVYGKRKS
jgi:hypothetical protein